MTVRVFVDSNVLVYDRDATEEEKQPQAEAWVRALWKARAGRISFQVLHEYYVTVTAKLKPGLTRKEAREDVGHLMAWKPLALDSPVLDHVAFDRGDLLRQDRFVERAQRDNLERTKS